MTAAAPVAAVIVTYNSAKYITACLSALEAQRAQHVDLRIIVVDNGSRDDTMAMVRRAALPVETIELGRNLGYAAAINVGWRSTRPGAHLLVLNPDIVVRDGAIARMVAALAASPPAVRSNDGRNAGRIGIVVPRLVGPDGATQASLRRRPTIRRVLGEALLGGERAGRHDGWGERVTRPSAYLDEHRIDWASGAAVLVHAACAHDVGPWDESFFLYSEETDYFLRAADLGWRAQYVPDAVVEHAGGELHSSPLLWSVLVANRVRLHRKRRGRVAASAFACALALNEVLRLHRGKGTHRAGLDVLTRPSQRARAIARLQGASPA